MRRLAFVILLLATLPARALDYLSLAEAAVMLLRFEAQRLWLVVDKSIAPYIHAWLVYAHQGAFASSTSTS